MKNPNTTLIIIKFSIGLVGALFLYLIFKTWEVFGFWTMVWTGFVESLSGLILGKLIGSRKEKNGVISYNPKELPKFINIIICAFVGYYLFTIISNSNIVNYDYYFGLTYIILLTALPVSWSVYKLIRDRNDLVIIDELFLSYRDNAKTGKFEIAQIQKIDSSAELTIYLLDGTEHKIMLSNMNFNYTDRSSLIEDINARVPKTEQAEEKNYSSSTEIPLSPDNPFK